MKRTYLITGASSGLGYEIAKSLLEQGFNTILVARRLNILKDLEKKYPKQATSLSLDLTNVESINKLINIIPPSLMGVFINAGGPPANSFKETNIKEWDNAYTLLVRWKIELLQKLLPIFIKNNFGRVVFSESNSVTTPIENLVLSNSLRMVTIGLMKSLVIEYSKYNITFNTLAPGYHETEALERIYKKMMVEKEITKEAAKQSVVDKIPLKKLGKVSDYASFACWLLTKQSDYITGQVINIDGGVSI